ncbi:carbamoyltransferase HypF [Mesorhizobium sp. WSM4307]|uniref:carbamoyltransferase HypF n=1 Tax=unclassified Mesorhizobium TaxID=325217 RepID=UPI000BAEB10B|nr:MULTISPECIES: carbamoyltransferase HypF [unclassified Mesorhizobium]PBB24439.1 carbamoyltransferase HypF [Mesorhizobium sp. WSM4304]PBB74593.1 carbamoyltransferase HypF [Mesorhizobium sp. WSM4308]TRC73240.1 carbamoyltransferase HypF [Mesorhizobium sp. WSM4315]TRC83519.1 carbamoyltransferase HypF [Mesorhizobium sp. WSM4307]
MNTPLRMADATRSVEIRVRGRVQGVGFRPTVWRIASRLGLDGDVLNDSQGVLIRVRGVSSIIAALVEELRASPPPLADITAIETRPCVGELASGFVIVDSEAGARARTEISPDAAMCSVCAAEVLDPFLRRFRYPFTNCTHCGPRLSIVGGVPYDRATTTMAPFPLCQACGAEYRDPADRRFHAEATACFVCGPTARLIRFDGRAFSFEQHSMLDDVDAALSLIQKGEIVAIKALGGYQLACDATRPEAVALLRQRKRRDAKPFALMARDLDVVRRHATVSDAEAAALASREAPIVLLAATGPEKLPAEIAPGLQTLGFMLPSTPLHLLLLRRMGRPVVMTSGNLSDEPQLIDDAEAAAKLSSIAPYALTHNRDIANRIDDSVVRHMGAKLRVLRRARGYAPASIQLPPGFEPAPDILAYGAELKATFCLIKDARAVLSQHQGDLEDALTYDDYRKNLVLYRDLFDHRPAALAADLHPEYLSAKLARATARSDNLPLVEVQHHHAHAAACLAENGRSLNADPVLAIVLDGLGYGSDGTIWGGEFLLADYRRFERLGTFKPVAMPGGAQAIREPWRNLHAHVLSEMGWPAFAMNFGELDLFAALTDKPLASVEAMIKASLNSPNASSCGRLFDAVAASLGICFDRQAYEGEAAARLEAMVSARSLDEEGDALAYPLPIPNLKGSGLPYIEPLGMWNAVFGDLILKTPASLIAARFHKGLAKSIAAMALKLARRDEDGAVPRFDTVALSGGCFQNKVLFEQVIGRLEDLNFNVLTHSRVPCNDGGVAFGQAAIAAAHLIDAGRVRQKAS